MTSCLLETHILSSPFNSPAHVYMTPIIEENGFEASRKFWSIQHGRVLWRDSLLASPSRYLRASSLSIYLFSFCYLQGKTPQERAQQAGDPDLAAYLESRQNFKIMGHEDLETAVWPWLTGPKNSSKRITYALPATGQLPWKKLMEFISASLLQGSVWDHTTRF